jgi:hypothetical protein
MKPEKSQNWTNHGANSRPLLAVEDSTSRFGTHTAKLIEKQLHSKLVMVIQQRTFVSLQCSHIQTTFAESRRLPITFKAHHR